jgi:hypothetical protein
MSLDETTLGALSGYSTTLSSTRAYRIVRVKAKLNNLTDSVLLYPVPRFVTDLWLYYCFRRLGCLQSSVVLMNLQRPDGVPGLVEHILPRYR